MQNITRQKHFLHSISRKYSKLCTKSAAQNRNSENIRNTFIEFFKSNYSHEFIRSSSVVPFCDPTVPFVNAGMNQFKNIFLGLADAPCPAAVNSQKCIRVGGKHNDLDVVGTDGYHHTFFEMLGNWSFGDYFKQKACTMAWQLLTKEYKIDPSRLYVTYFAGDKSLHLDPDFECREIWRQIGVSEDRILPYGMKENFWEMGATGPCGPCTEIHIDHLPQSDPSKRAKYVNADRPDLTELWNIVFIQYFRNVDGTITRLPRQFVDTGMGFERLTAILQNKSSNYDTDLFVPIFDAISKKTKLSAYSGSFDPSTSQYELDTAYRKLVDHARMSTICIGDGLYPDNGNRLRHIFRKTVEISENTFKNSNILREVIVPGIVESLGSAYPELGKNFEKILTVFDHEIYKYKSLITTSSKAFKELQAYKEISEHDAIEYPGLLSAFRNLEKELRTNRSLDHLTVERLYSLQSDNGLDGYILDKMAKAKNLTAEIDALPQYAEEQRKLKKAKMINEKDDLIENVAKMNLPKTDDSSKYLYEFDWNEGVYCLPKLQAKVLYIETIENENSKIILNQTNFYSTAGGQDCDQGTIECNGKVFHVESVETKNDYVIHTGTFSEPTQVFGRGDLVELNVDVVRRTALSRHHTGIHLLQAAIKHVTNKIIYQKSSHAAVDYLRFNMGIIGERLATEEIAEVEALINDVIQSPTDVKTDFLSAHEFYASDRITVLPGAIYPDHNIRIRRIEKFDNGFASLEPCCGTHVNSTAELECFTITSFKNNKLGTFDITAVCGPTARQFIESGNKVTSLVNHIESKTAGKNVSANELLSLQKQLKNLKVDLKDNEVPYVVKFKALKDLEALDKKINISIRENERKIIKEELAKAVEKSEENGIVHVLNSDRPLEHLLLQNATDLISETPAILLNTCDGKLCSIRVNLPKQKWSSIDKIFLEILKQINATARIPKLKSKDDFIQFSIVFDNKNPIKLDDESVEEFVNKFRAIMV